MKIERMKLAKRFLLIILLFLICCSISTLSKGAVNYLSLVEAKKDAEGNILLKYNSEDRWLEPKLGQEITITTQVLGLPYVYCIQNGQGIKDATYRVNHIEEEVNNAEAYKLATKSDRSQNSSWHYNKADRVQISVWLSKDLNQGKIDLSNVKENMMKPEGEDAGLGMTNDEAEAALNRGRDLDKIAQAFETYRNNYQKNTPNGPKVMKNNGTLGENNIIGPFQIKYVSGKYGSTVFGGIESYSLTGKDANGKSVTLANGTDWTFCDKNGNNIGTPKSDSDFYIQVKNQNITEINKLTFNISKTEAYAKWYELLDTNPTERHQTFCVVDNGWIRKNTNPLNLNINVQLNIKLAGHVFLDVQDGKGLEVNGIKDNADTMLSGITVKLRKYSNKSVVATTKTDKNGYYEFKVKPDTYYIEFIYDGQNYEPTTYNMQRKEIADGVYNKTGIPERSYATDGRANRDNFNKVYEEIKGDVARTREISAFTGSNGEQALKTYSAKNSKEERENINLGLMEREKVNLVLNKDLWEVRLEINGYPETYIYNDRDGEDMTIQLRGTDVEQYERAVRKTDVPYVTKFEVTYRIRLYNGSGYIDTQVSELVDWYDSSYQIKRLYKDDGTDIGFKEEERGNNYTKIRTTNYNSGSFTSGESRYVYADYTIDANTVKDLINGEETLENYAEIGGYKTFYHDTRMDLNNELVMHESGAVAGLIDTNSEPNNFDPNRAEVDKFVHETSKTDEYKNLSDEEQAKRSFEFFQDDADVAPGLKFILSDEERTISGNVWDDNAVLTEGPDDAPIRIGDGFFNTDTEKGLVISGVKVELRDSKTNAVIKETRTDSYGSYSLSGYLPGKYYIQFTYGDEEALKNHDAKYNGQDYKSTVYDTASHTEDYWYAEDWEARYSDAYDDMNRREEVNEYSKKMTNYKATLLSPEARAEGQLGEYVEETYMRANTADMTMEVEYNTQVTPYPEEPEDQLPVYKVQNVDFGLAERARSQLTIEKKVSNVRMVSHNGQEILAVTNTQGPNLAWIPNKYAKNEEGQIQRTQGYIQATVDTSLTNNGSIYIDYEITIENTGENNFIDRDTGKEDEDFYLTGKPGKNAIRSSARADYIVDYLNNNMVYDVENNKDASGNTLWTVVADPNTELFKDDVKATTVDNTLKGNITSNYKTILKASDTNPLVTTSLLPPKEMGEDVDGDKVTTTLHLKQDGLSTGAMDTLQYDNSMEIVELTDQTGRRQQWSIVGNFDPTADIDITTLEPDSSVAETVTVLPPFGNSNLYYLIGAIVIVIVLGVGIFFIIRKVMPRKK